MFVHNMAYSGTLDDFSAEDIEAVEVYVGTSEVPAELDKNGKGVCGAIVVWTRDPRAFGKTPPGAGFWNRAQQRYAETQRSSKRLSRTPLRLGASLR